MKTFLLGVGCQKGGTTWLYDYLKSNPRVVAGFGKEYHVLDCIFLPQMSRILAATRMKISDLDQRQSLDIHAKRERQYLQNRLDFVENADAYFDHFARMLEGAPDGSVTCDITPSYAALPEEAYRLVQESMLRRGVAVKVVFLLRDPVDRIISHLRMLRARSAERRHACTEVEDIQKNYASWDFEVRTRYEDTIRKLEAVFPAEDILYLFYEELFTIGSIRTLCQHLGLESAPADFSKVVNASPAEGRCPDELRRRIQNHYQATYAFVAEHLTVERVRQAWPTIPG